MSNDKWEKRFLRERNAKKEAERLLEEKSLELWEVNQSLEENVKQRTIELHVFIFEFQYMYY